MNTRTSNTLISLYLRHPEIDWQSGHWHIINVNLRNRLIKFSHLSNPLLMSVHTRVRILNNGNWCDNGWNDNSLIM